MYDEYSNLTNSDSKDRDGYYHFQFHNNFMEPQKWFQMFLTWINNRNQTPGVGVVLQQVPENLIKSTT